VYTLRRRRQAASQVDRVAIAKLKREGWGFFGTPIRKCGSARTLTSTSSFLSFCPAVTIPFVLLAKWPLALWDSGQGRMVLGLEGPEIMVKVSSLHFFL
jgi:hypothetical protein